MKLIYGVSDRPGFFKTLMFALQQLLAIVSATIAVPMIVGNGLQPSAALFGAGVATIIYLLVTKFRSPVFFGSSFAFIGSMCAAFAGATSMQLGYLGIILGSTFAGLVSIICGILVKKFGVEWIYKLLPYVVIGPIVAIIGLSLAGTAVSSVLPKDADGALLPNWWVSLGIALITLATTIIVSVYGKGMRKLVPFAIGIGIGYVLSLAVTGVGYLLDVEILKVIDFTPFKNMQWYPDFTFLTAKDAIGELTWEYVGTIALAFVPVSMVTLTEHIADHQNISTIIEEDLFKNPGLHRTLIGDGLADAFGAALGGCSTTSYGESVGCVALTKNASTISIFTAALMAIAVSFIAPVSALLSTIPGCVLNAVCFLLYGFIAVSGLKMLKKVDLEDNRNVFVASVILIAGVGGFSLKFGSFEITTVACSLILGVFVNLIVSKSRKLDEIYSRTEEEDNFIALQELISGASTHVEEDVSEENLDITNEEFLDTDTNTMNTSNQEDTTGEEHVEDLLPENSDKESQEDNDNELSFDRFMYSKYKAAQLSEIVTLLSRKPLDKRTNSETVSELFNEIYLNSLTKNNIADIISVLNVNEKVIKVNKSSTKQELIRSLLDFARTYDK